MALQVFWSLLYDATKWPTVLLATEIDEFLAMAH